MFHVTDVLKTSVRPDRAHVRTVLAGVFNRDDASEELIAVEVVVILASKMLLDMNHKSSHVQAICRFLGRFLGQRLLEAHLFDAVAILSIADNRYATVVGTELAPVYDFVEGREVKNPPAPLLQMSINLTRLLELVRAEALSRDSRAEAGAASAGDEANPAAP